MRAVALLLLAALLPVTPPQHRLTRRVVLCVDVSGSMDPRASEALAALRVVAEQPTDELEVLLVAWDDTARTYPGGWLSLPDAEGLERAEEWLRGQSAGRGTWLLPALRVALSEPRGELSVVVVSDGQVCEPREGLLAAVEALQVERLVKGHGRAVIACLGVGPEAPSLRALAQAGGGGYWRWAPDVVAGGE